MDKKRLKRALGGAILLAILIAGISYNGYVKTHTFTLSGNERVKSEEIQPVSGSVKITSTADTDVVFTDIKSGEIYVIGYITSGVGETIKLERGKWYRVEGIGELTVSETSQCSYRMTEKYSGCYNRQKKYENLKSLENSR